jgi:hypothetical protein
LSEETHTHTHRHTERQRERERERKREIFFFLSPSRQGCSHCNVTKYFSLRFAEVEVKIKSSGNPDSAAEN